MLPSRLQLPSGESVLSKARVPEMVIEAVAEALEQSNTLNLSEDRKKVMRKDWQEIPPEKYKEMAKELDSRTVHARPLSMDSKIEKLEKFFKRETSEEDVSCPDREIA